MQTFPVSRDDHQNCFCFKKTRVSVDYCLDISFQCMCTRTFTYDEQMVQSDIILCLLKFQISQGIYMYFFRYKLLSQELVL